MTLENLLEIGRLKAHTTARGEIQQLLEAARRNLADAAVTAVRQQWDADKDLVKY